MLMAATLESKAGKLFCTLVTEGDERLSFEIADKPELHFGKSSKADNTHVDLTLTVRVANLITLNHQPDLL